jgi:hypothetical protein
MTIAARVKLSGLVAAGMVAFGAGLAPADPMPDSENGRYALSPITDGVLRLDTRTGAVSTCTNTNGNGWACYVVPDERAALDTEIGRLEADNEKLKAQLAARDQAPPKIDEPKITESLPKGDSLKPLPAEPKVAEGQRKIEIPRIEIPLPSDRDMDRMMTALEQAWRRLVDMANRMQKDVSGRI